MVVRDLVLGRSFIGVDQAVVGGSMIKKKKKKHPEDFVGKTVTWTRQTGTGPARLCTGKVIRQEIILQVKLPDGQVVGIDSRLVRVEQPHAGDGI